MDLLYTLFLLVLPISTVIVLWLRRKNRRKVRVGVDEIETAVIRNDVETGIDDTRRKTRWNQGQRENRRVGEENCRQGGRAIREDRSERLDTDGYVIPRERERCVEMDRQMERERCVERNRQIERERQMEKDRLIEIGRQMERDRLVERGREIERDRQVGGYRRIERDSENGSERQVERDREVERERQIREDRWVERDRDRMVERDRERDRQERDRLNERRRGHEYDMVYDSNENLIRGREHGDRQIDRHDYDSVYGGSSTSRSEGSGNEEVVTGGLFNRERVGYEEDRIRGEDRVGDIIREIIVREGRGRRVMFEGLNEDRDRFENRGRIAVELEREDRLSEGEGVDSTDGGDLSKDSLEDSEEAEDREDSLGGGGEEEGEGFERACMGVLGRLGGLIEREMSGIDEGNGTDMEGYEEEESESIDEGSYRYEGNYRHVESERESERESDDREEVGNQFERDNGRRYGEEMLKVTRSGRRY